MTKKELLLVGIDEAGLGPLLGPLTVGKSVVNLDGERYHNDKIPNLWVIFGHIISKDKKASDKIIVTDSKKLHKPGKIVALEETVLSAMHSIYDFDKRPTVEEFLSVVCKADEIERIKTQPWFEDLSLALPIEASADLVKHRGKRLSKIFLETGANISELRVQVVTAKLFNDLIDKYNNKSHAHWVVVASLIREVFSMNFDSTVIVDKQGGRDFYGDMLQKSLPNFTIHAHSEGKRLISRKELKNSEQEERKFSDYFVESDLNKHKIAFVSQAEDYSLPVALASCVAKYTREVLMHVFNNYFRKQFAEIKPTKGYYTDGMRFIGDLTKLGYPLENYRDFLVRKR